MAINVWRYVHYTDDGCAIYQCLRCYGRWEGRGEPGYIHHETGEYVACWHFCPLCGTHWDGKRTTAAEKLCDKALGPRRQRIWEATDRWQWGPDGWRSTEQYQPPFYWVLEVRQASAFIGKSIEQQPWAPHNWINGLSMSAKDVLAHSRYLQKQLQDDVSDRPRYDLDGELVQAEWTTQVRITVTRTTPRYGSQLRWPLNA